MAQEDRKELPVYKVALCGKSGVGKTSIFRRLRGDGFEIDTSKFQHLAEEKIEVQVEEKTIIVRKQLFIYYDLMTTTKNKNKPHGRSVKDAKPYIKTDQQNRRKNI